MRLVGTFLIALVVAACGGAAATAAPTTAPTASATAAPSDSPAASPSTDATACIDVTHALGDSCIPANPARVVTLGCQTSLEYALALGLPVVGYDVGPWEPIVPPYLDQSKLAGATQLGSCFAPDLELVKQADPDLIIYTFDNGNYPQVSEIAPTVVLTVGYADWRDDFLAAAELLGRTDAANTVLTDLDTRIADLAADLAPVLGGKTVSAFQTGAEGKATAYGAASYIGALLADLGLTLPPEQNGSYMEVSLEQIGLLDGDAALVTYGFTDPAQAEGGETTKQQFLSSPLWQTLKFVQNDALYESDPQVWGVHGIYWVDGMLEDIRSSVLGS